MGNLLVRRHGEHNFCIEYECSTPHLLTLDITKDPEQIINTIDRAGRLYRQLDRDYPGVNIAKTPKYGRMNSEILWYAQLFEDYYKYFVLKPPVAKFDYNKLLKQAVAYFHARDSARQAFHGVPIAELYLCNVNAYAQAISGNDKLDMVELLAPHYFSLNTMLKARVPRLDISEIERIVHAASRQLENSNSAAPKVHGADYAEVMRKEMERRHAKAREEMLRELRAANRWK